MSYVDLKLTIVSWNKLPGNSDFRVTFVYLKPDIGMMVRVFANGPGDLGSIPGRVIPKTRKKKKKKKKKMVLDASLLNTQHYKGKNQG